MNKKFKVYIIIGLVAGLILLSLGGAGVGYFIYRQSFITCQKCSDPATSPTPLTSPSANRR